MLLGVVGAPNKGKSTFFAAVTMVDAAIANYPFTTTTASRGVTYVRAQCPHVELGLKACNPKNSKCVDGVRLVPVGIIDTPGLVPEAHKGRGLGNRFLDSLREADVFIQVVDGSGKTDLHGNPCQGCSPMDEVAFLKEEIAMWVFEIMKRKGGGRHLALKEAALSLSGLRISEGMLLQAAASCGLEVGDGTMPDDDGMKRIAQKLVEMRFPIAVAFNKVDLPGAKEEFEKARQRGLENVFACSAAIELALRKAAEHGLIEYAPGQGSFKLVGTPDEKQKEALSQIDAFLKAHKSSGVQEIIDWAVYKKMGAIVVYPVEDEHRLSNHKGEILPDAFLVPKGTTARQLAGMVHSELAAKFIGAIDVKRKTRIGADHLLGDGDVIKIIAGR
ncbi:MAG: YchF-related putative GTPase [Candidatus Micrarchaeota archaeon]|nr:YchF-related putative GTPase [Candidatus Micrarchaeota archaeon]